MALRLVLLALSASSFGAVPAQTSIAIVNRLFIDGQMKCEAGQNCFEFGISGWISGPRTNLHIMSRAHYPSAPESGIYTAAMGYSAGSGSIFHTVGATLKANTTYTLNVEVGARADFAFTGYKAELLAGNVVIAKGNSATPVGGTL